MTSIVVAVRVIARARTTALNARISISNHMRTYNKKLVMEGLPLCEKSIWKNNETRMSKTFHRAEELAEHINRNEHALAEVRYYREFVYNDGYRREHFAGEFEIGYVCPFVYVEYDRPDSEWGTEYYGIFFDWYSNLKYGYPEVLIAPVVPYQESFHHDLQIHIITPTSGTLPGSKEGRRLNAFDLFTPWNLFTKGKASIKWVYRYIIADIDFTDLDDLKFRDELHIFRATQTPSTVSAYIPWVKRIQYNESRDSIVWPPIDNREADVPTAGGVIRRPKQYVKVKDLQKWVISSIIW